MKHTNEGLCIQVEGVRAFVGAEDVPGENKVNLALAETELFAFDKVRWQEQPLGVIVATTPEIAQKAAALVEVKYSPAKVNSSSTLQRNPSSFSRTLGKIIQKTCSLISMTPMT